MSLPKPAFFQSDRLPRWRSALLIGWMRLRLRVRHQPGFVAATAAGSIGLVLALILLFNGGWKTFSAAPAAESVAETEPELGEPESAPPAHHVAATGDAAFNPREVSRASAPVMKDDWRQEEPEAVPSLPVVKKQSSTKSVPSTLTAFGDEPEDSAESLPERRSTPAPRRPEPQEPLLSSNDTSSGLKIEESAEESAEPAAEKPALVEEEPTPLKNSKPVISRNAAPGEAAEPREERGFLADDAPLTSNEDREPPARSEPTRGSPPLRSPPVSEAESEPEQEPEVETPTATKSPATKPPTTTVITAEPATESTRDEPAHTDDEPFLQPKAKSSWKNSTNRPEPAVKSPPSKAIVPESPAESESVETAVYATPEERPTAPATMPSKAPATREPPARDDADAKGVTLEIRSPRGIAAGQTFDLEFIVRNTRRAPVRGASLSVALPDGLSHPLGRELELPISLAGCEVYRARLTVKATAAGDQTPKADVSLQGRMGPESTTTLRVGPARTATTSGSTVPCDCPPVRYVW